MARSRLCAAPRNSHPSTRFGDFASLRRNWLEDTLLDHAGMAQFLRRFVQKQFNRYKTK